jgi:hypothetical protein
VPRGGGAQEIVGLAASGTYQPALGRVSLIEWLKENASTLGRAYAYELDRHFGCADDLVMPEEPFSSRG